MPAPCNLAASAPDLWLVANTFSGATLDVSGHATFALTAYALGGLTGNIALTAEGLSSLPGLTGSFNPSKISTTGPSVLTVTASPLVAPGRNLATY